MSNEKIINCIEDVMAYCGLYSEELTTTQKIFKDGLLAAIEKIESIKEE